MADDRDLMEKAPWLLLNVDGFCDGRYHKWGTASKLYVPLKTVPKSPNLITAKRIRAKRKCRKTAECGVKPPMKKKPRIRKDEKGKVIVEEFKLSKPRFKPVIKEEVKTFKARAMPDHSKKPLIKKQKKKGPTKVEAFTLQTDVRGSKQMEAAKKLESITKLVFRALPMPDFTHKPLPEIKGQGKVTVPVPFQMEKRQKKSDGNNNNKMNEEKREFKALPLPNFKNKKFVTVKSTRELTKPVMKRLPTDIRAEESINRWQELRSRANTNVETKKKKIKEKEDLREQKALEEIKKNIFKARPPPDFQVAHKQEEMRLQQTWRKVELTIPISPFVHRKRGDCSASTLSSRNTVEGSTLKVRGEGKRVNHLAAGGSLNGHRKMSEEKDKSLVANQANL